MQDPSSDTTSTPPQDEPLLVASKTCPTCNLSLSAFTIKCPRDGTLLMDAFQTGGILADKYEFEREIGSGGIGVIYKARQIALNKPVAIKMLHSHKMDPHSMMRFQREAQAASLLRHENIISVTDFGVTEDGRPYMVMDFVQGLSLSDWIERSGRLPLDLCLNVFLQVCSGMIYAHHQGVVHRDLKPSNIMLSGMETGKPSVHIVDFGIAKIMNSGIGNAKSLTMTGEVFGSPPYMSPEQCKGEETDPRSDIYSIGCIMFETLTGSPPFSGSSVMEVLLMQLNEPAPKMSDKTPAQTYPRWLESIIAKTLAKNPAQRFQTVFALKAALVSRTVQDEETSKKNRSASLNSNNSLMVATLGCAVIALLTVTGYLVIHRSTAPSKADNFSFAKEFDQSLSENNKGESAIIEAAVDLKHKALSNLGDETVNLKRRRLSNDDFRELRDKTNISALSLMQTDLTDQQLAAIQNHQTITRLSIGDNRRLTGEAFKQVSELPSLEALDVRGIHIKDSDLKLLQKLKSLHDLNVSNNNLSDNAISFLLPLKALTNLNVENNPRIGDRGLTMICNSMNGLTILSLNHTGITDEGLKHIGRLKGLTTLDIGDTAVSDKGLQALKGLPLTELHLHLTKTTDEGVKSIAKLKRLRVLYIYSDKVTDKGLALLSKMPLTDLRLGNAPITDKGLPSLYGCTALRELNLDGCRQVSPEAVAVLQKHLPDCAIQGPAEP